MPVPFLQHTLVQRNKHTEIRNIFDWKQGANHIPGFGSVTVLRQQTRNKFTVPSSVRASNCCCQTDIFGRDGAEKVEKLREVQTSELSIKVWFLAVEHSESKRPKTNDETMANTESGKQK